ncbi:MAG: TonB-dependent receptor [Cyclobacteriaceae bacterium]
MKNQLLKVLMMSSKVSIYILILKSFLVTALAASDTKAQYKSVHEVLINLDLKNASVKTVLDQIEKRTDYLFQYYKRDIPRDVKIDVKSSEISVGEVLYSVSAKTNLKFRQVNNSIAIAKRRKSEGDFVKVLEEVTVSGKILDENGEPLPGVTVVIKGTTSGTITDIDGNYTITVEDDAILVFSFVGFESQEIAVGSRTTIDVVLGGATELDEVVVVAYGTAKKGSFVGAATQINAEALEGRAITNITQAIQGAAGVQLSSSDGQPGASSNFRIRGFGSINVGSEPAYILDGVLFTGSLSSINPQDVESITVLKDASSTAIYGAIAANGLIMITTKQGKEGQSKFSVNLSRGTSARSIDEYDRVSAEEFYPLMWEVRRNSIALPGTAGEAVANETASAGVFSLLETNPFNVPNDKIVGTDGKLNPAAKLLYPDDLDWQDEITRAGSRTNFDLSYQGGTATSSQFLSLSYLDDKGWVEGTDFERVAGRINLSAQPKDWIKTGLNLSATSSVSNQANDAGSTNSINPFNSSRNVGPIYGVFEHDPVTGEFLLDENGERIYDAGANRVGTQVGRNVIWENRLQTDVDKIFSVSGRTFLDVHFLKDFKFTLNNSIDKRFFVTEDFDSELIGDAQGTGRASKRTITNTTLNFNQLLNYTKTFGEHSISVLLGHESFALETDRVRAAKNTIVAPGSIELPNFTVVSDADSYERELKREGYLSRVEYNYGGKYFASGSFRRDASSKFDKEDRWGNFFSIGGAWRLDKEAFLQGNSLIDQLKLRASYGETGNDGGTNFDTFSYFASQGLFSIGADFNNAGEAGFILNTLPSPGLKWEVSQQSDIALEFSLLDYRLTGTIEYYKKASEDLLFEVPLPNSSGVLEINRNIGAVENSGVEIQLSGEIIRKQDFSWRLDVNAATIKNEITKLPQDSIINGTKQYVKGGSVFSFWRRIWYGVDPEDGSALYVADSQLTETDSNVRLVNGTLVTTDQDDAQMGFVGTALPDLFGSITNTFTYKNFKLGFLFTYQIGGKTYDTNYRALMSAGSYGSALHTDILQRWQKPGDVTNVPRLDASTSAAADAHSSRWLVSSSFVSLRQITFSYDLPNTLIDVTGLENARLYVNAENLWTNTKRQGMETVQDFNGTTENRFSPPRVVTVGINVTF